MRNNGILLHRNLRRLLRQNRRTQNLEMAFDFTYSVFYFSTFEIDKAHPHDRSHFLRRRHVEKSLTRRVVDQGRKSRNKQGTQTR